MWQSGNIRISRKVELSKRTIRRWIQSWCRRITIWSLVPKGGFLLFFVLFTGSFSFFHSVSCRLNELAKPPNRSKCGISTHFSSSRHWRVVVIRLSREHWRNLVCGLLISCDPPFFSFFYEITRCWPDWHVLQLPPAFSSFSSLTLLGATMLARITWVENADVVIVFSRLEDPVNIIDLTNNEVRDHITVYFF